jgi:hypothetical protein
LSCLVLLTGFASLAIDLSINGGFGGFLLKAVDNLPEHIPLK